MTVYRIGEFKAQEGLSDKMREFLISIVPIITSSEGCQSCQLFQSQEDSHLFSMMEVWDSTENHQASAKNIPPELLAEIRPLLAAPPNGQYFDSVPI